MATGSTCGTLQSPNSSLGPECVSTFEVPEWLTCIDSSSIQWGAASVVIYVPAVGLAKVAILLFYLRLNPERGFRIIVYVALFFCTSYVFALSLAILLECNPVAKFWDPFLQGTCLDTTTLYLANAILNVIFDFVVLLVPVPMLLKLQTSARQKCVIAAIFSLGSITCVISAVRIYYQQQVVKHKADLSWHLVTPTSLVFVECNLSIICGCLMVLRPFLRRHFPGVLGGEYRRYNKSPGGDLVGGAYDGPHGPNSRSEYKTKISAAGYGKGSTLRSWPGGKNRSHGGDDGMDVGGDMELGRWGKKTGKSESEENIIVPPAAAEVRSEGYAPGILRTVDVDVRSGCG